MSRICPTYVPFLTQYSPNYVSVLGFTNFCPKKILLLSFSSPTFVTSSIFWPMYVHDLSPTGRNLDISQTKTNSSLFMDKVCMSTGSEILGFVQFFPKSGMPNGYQVGGRPWVIGHDPFLCWRMLSHTQIMDYEMSYICLSPKCCDVKSSGSNFFIWTENGQTQDL